MHAVELQNLSKSFVASAGIHRLGLCDVSIRIGVGEFVTIIGGNGSGKSTLLRAIAGFVDLDEGRVLLNSVDMTTRPPQARSAVVALVDQDPSRSCAADLTVAETIALASVKPFSAYFYPLLPQRYADALRRQLAGYNSRLALLWKNTVSNLSGGERQMLALATALIRGCDIFLLDEHTAALDPTNASAVWTLTEDLVTKRGKTVLVVTHDLARAIALEGRLIVMANGTVVADILPQERSTVSRDAILNMYVGERAGVR